MSVEMSSFVRAGLRSQQYNEITDGEEKPSTHTEDHRCQGWPTFVRKNLNMPLAMLSGILACAGVIWFTIWLSLQQLRCPDFAIDCQISNYATMINGNTGLIQGFTTAVYIIGLSAIAYAVHCVSECLIWPIFTQKPHTIAELDSLLTATRGSIPAIPRAAFSLRTTQSAVIFVITMVVTLVSLSGAPLMGYVYGKQNYTQLFESEHNSSGGMSR